MILLFYCCFEISFRSNNTKQQSVIVSNFIFIFSVLNAVLDETPVDAIVVQCGADGIAGDPLGGFNLTPLALGKCLSSLLLLRKPTLVLGGGEY